jgi:hypothetical protein
MSLHGGCSAVLVRAVVGLAPGGRPLSFALTKGATATIDQQSGLRQPAAAYRRVVLSAGPR